MAGSIVIHSPHLFPIGTTNVDGFARDESFNFSPSGPFQVHVKGAPEQLPDLSGAVTALGLPAGTANSLKGKLANASSALAAGNTAGACSALQDFISQVRAQGGKKIAAADATRLVADANRIRAVLAC